MASRVSVLISASPKIMDSTPLTVILGYLYMSHLSTSTLGILVDALKGHGIITVHLSDPENCGFDTNTAHLQVFYMSPSPKPRP